MPAKLFQQLINIKQGPQDVTKKAVMKKNCVLPTEKRIYKSKKQKQNTT